MQTQEYYSASKTKGILLFVATWINLEKKVKTRKANTT
jgi:hypothetical protein